MEGRAAAVRGAAVDVLGDGREQERRLGRFAAQVAGLATAEVIPGSDAPPIRARHCRAKISGTAEPCYVSGQRFWSSPRQPSTVPPCIARHRHLATPG